MPSVHSSPPNKRKASVDADAKVSVHSSPPKARKPPLDTGATRKPALDFGKESRKSERVLRLAAGLTEQSEDMPDALVLRGSRRSQIPGQTRASYHQGVTHLHLSGLGLVGDIASVSLCPNLKVLYAYDNKLTSLRGLGGLKQLTHLYAQQNEIASLDDFEAPLGVEQVLLQSNRLRAVRGLGGTLCVSTLNVGGQRPALAESEAASPIELDLDSLHALAPTLTSLNASGCALEDGCLAPLACLRKLTSLDLSHNALSLGAAESLVAQLPRIATLSLAGNPAVADAPKWRERLIACAERHLAEIDGKVVTDNERAFLQRLAMRNGRCLGERAAAASAQPGTRPPPRGAGAGSAPPAGRPLSYDCRRSYEISFRGLDGMTPAGMGKATGASTGLPGGNPLQKKKEAEY